MNPIQKLVTALNEGRNIFLTGAGGTGKSYIIKQLLQKYPRNFVVTSSTGISAYALYEGASTIHSFSGIGIESFNEEDYASGIKFQEKVLRTHLGIRPSKVEAIARCERLIIDEISMISKGQLDLIDQMLRMCRATNKPEYLEMPFGGIKVIITGDFLQLPSIAKNGEEPSYAFESKVWKEANLKTIFLKEIKRTNNIEFAQFLHKLRVGDWNTEDFFYLQRMKKTEHLAPPVKLFATNYKVDRYNNEQLALVDSPLITLKAKWRGEPDDIRELKKGILAPDTLELKVGCRVMVLINKPEEDGYNDCDYVNGSTGFFMGMKVKTTKRPVWIIEKDYLNGEIRKFKDFKEYEVAEIKLDNGNIIELRRKSWDTGEMIYDDILEAEVPKTEFSQFPIKLAYALTSHKAQGASIENLEIDASKFFAPNQFYVALSRATDPTKIKIVNLKTYHIKTCPKALEFYKGLEDGISKTVHQSESNTHS